ncbi:MAG: hypothetical protein IKO93_12475, partial [Lentisphaeria bacterium]|nr:hypothetical protein [Lentisphaeria bacterium]
MTIRKTMLFCALFCTTAVFALSPLPSGKAPFQRNKAEGQSYSGDAVLDSEKLTYNYGTKKLVFREDGTFSILSNGRQLGKTYFFIATPYQYWQTNNGGRKKAGEYDGKRIEVRDIKIDGNQIAFEGLVPWNKKDEKLLAAAWHLTVKPLGKGRFAFYYNYDIPEGYKRRDCGIFMQIANIRQMDAGAAGVWNPDIKNKIIAYKPTVLKFAGNNPEDDFSIESNNWSTQQSVRFAFRLKDKSQSSFILDLGTSRPPDAIRKTGGVDLLVTDALNVPERGIRNLL